MNNFLDTSIAFLKGVGPNRAELLRKEIGVSTYRDMVQYYPFRFEDRRKIFTIQEVSTVESSVQLIGVILRFGIEGQGKGKRLKALFQDKTGTMELVWFRGIDWVKKSLEVNVPYLVQGKPVEYRGFYSITHPEFSIYDEAAVAKQMRIKPIYPLTEMLKKRGVDNKYLAKLSLQIVSHNDFLPEEYMPNYLLQKYALENMQRAQTWIHAPENNEHITAALKRLKFNELFNLQFKILKHKESRQEKFKGYAFESIGEFFNTFYKDHLGFDLTNAQKRVLKEIRKDVQTGAQMNRLIQGDVGSGKTIVAWFAILMAIDNNTQASLMAPTEILAQQHYSSFKEYGDKLGLKVALLTGSTKKKDRLWILEDLASGELDVVVGTHALIEDPVVFNQLGMVIIDEQHRFGVAQRAKLWTKYNPAPHVLVMTATPIPRTLAMTVYGDLEVSVIDEMPPGRKPVQTIHKYQSKLPEVLLFSKSQIEKGKQVYIVYPLINESEKLDYQDLMSAYDDVIAFFPLPEYHISLVHGQLKPQEKDAEMQRFKEGKTQIMMATTVIEVGVNVPNASVMIIQNAERFGLSQLHQLRGRVGRSSSQAYCILLSSAKLTKTGKKRIEAMVSTTDGFELAELDMKLRGPGEMDGTRQSGLLDLNLSSITKDEGLLNLARSAIKELLQSDPDLKESRHTALRNFLKTFKKGELWRRIS